MSKLVNKKDASIYMYMYGIYSSMDQVNFKNPDLKSNIIPLGEYL